MFSTTDFNTRSVYGRLQSVIGLRGRKAWGLALVILAPIAILSAVTLREGCFFLESVVTPGFLGGKQCQLIGMSFVGDPMAWGFSLLVPILIVVLKMATDRTIVLVNTVMGKASDAWKNDTSKAGLDATMRKTKAIWKMRVRKPLRYLLVGGPWILAVVFWGYNTVTCGLHPWLPAWYPYNSERVKIVVAGEPNAITQNSAAKPAELITAAGSILKFDNRDVRLARKIGVAKTVLLEKPIPLKKWDCQPETAPLSCWLTRIWTLFYYGAIPFLARHLLLVIWGATAFLNAGTKWEDQKDDPQIQAVEINPFHPDGFGGLGALSDSVIIYLYSVSFFAMLVGLAFLKEGTQPSWHNYALMLLFLPIGVWGFLAPSVAVRHTILNAKNRYLAQLGTELHAIGNSILDALPTGTLTKQLKDQELDKQQKAVRELYDDVKRMSEWPFNAMTLARMTFPIAAPWLPAILKEVVGPYFK
ncbi:MAG: hypothetical protein ABR611_05840 [Chthoniobacterales bacterium]